MGSYEELELYNIQARRYLYPIGHKRIIKSLASSSIFSGRVLDIGSGTGILCMEIARTFKHLEVLGIDVSCDMLCIAEKSLREEGFKSRVKFIHADALNLPFSEKSFDAVVSYVSLHHWKDAASVLSEIKRVLKKDGKAFVYDLRRRKENLIFAPLIKDESMRKLFIASLMASYTPEEIKPVLDRSGFAEWKIGINAINLEIEAIAG